jgi:hypothetical protein
MPKVNSQKVRHAIDGLRASTRHVTEATKRGPDVKELLKSFHEMDKALDKVEDAIGKRRSKSAFKRKSPV